MKSRSGFTLIELLVVMAIIGILVGLLLPAVQMARESARRSQCMNNLKQMGIGCVNYHDTFRAFPSGHRANVPYNNAVNDTTPGWGWGALILPWMEQGALAADIQFNLPIEHPANAKAVSTSLSVYRCPSDVMPSGTFVLPNTSGQPLVKVAPCSYAACVGNDLAPADGPTGNGILFRNSAVRAADIRDGLSMTIVIGERAWSNAKGVWIGAPTGGVLLMGDENPNPVTPSITATAPILVQAHAHLLNATQEPDGATDDFSSNHVGGALFVFADGSVRYIHDIPTDAPNSYTADGLMFQALGTRAGGEALGGLERF